MAHLAKVVVACAALAVWATPSDAHAAPTPSGKIQGKGGNFGVGMSFGAPTGASLKLFLHPNHALQWHLGWMPLHHNSGAITMSYLWAPGTFVSNSVMDFFGYLGLGFGGFLFAHGTGFGHGHGGLCHSHGSHGRHCHGDPDTDDHHGGNHAHGGFILRAPVLGLAFHWKKFPMDTVMEGSWSPALPEFVHGPRVDLAHGEVSVKARYYF